MARWEFAASDRETVDALCAELGITAPAARVLCARGLSDPVAARRFLNPTLEDLHDPLEMRDMDAALARLRRAVSAREKVLVYGDYDVDGTTSVVILVKAIEMAGGVAEWHVPHRLTEGYGMRPEVVEKAAADGVTLIVSVDTGIRAAEVVVRANELAIDVIVTDHHLPESGLPPAVAILNPNRPDCSYPNKDLCGAGVAFKLVQGLLGGLGWPAGKLRRALESFLKLVAIGTVADVVPLVGENRIMVRHGLASLHQVRNPGLRALLDVAGFTSGKTPSARQVAFQIAPRMNAAGRMDTARDVVEMFLTNDVARARELATQLNDQNAERQQVEATIRDYCLAQGMPDGAAGLIFCGDGWHRGVLGIVASRMVERYHRPAFVLATGEDGLAQGSGRSIKAFHLLDALESMADLFLKFGGHRHAAGLTLEAARVDEFRQRFNEYAATRLTAADFEGEVTVDAVVTPAEITDESVADLLTLAPFGHGNPAPLVAVLGAEVAGMAPLGEKGQRVTLRGGGRQLVVKAWGDLARTAELRPGMRVDAAFLLEEDVYSAARGYAGWAATLREVRAAAE